MLPISFLESERGQSVSRRAVASLAAFFTPLISSSTFEHKFGPGFYTTPSPKYALEYAGLDGVILILNIFRSQILMQGFEPNLRLYIQAGSKPKKRT